MEYPTTAEIEMAGHTMLGMWYRFLPIASTPEENFKMGFITGRFERYGGMTPELSKQIGTVPPKEG